MHILAILMALVPQARADSPHSSTLYPCASTVEKKATDSFESKPQNKSKGLSVKKVKITHMTKTSEAMFTYIVEVTGSDNQTSMLPVHLYEEAEKCLKSFRPLLGQNSIQPDGPTPYTDQMKHEQTPIAIPVSATGSQAVGSTRGR